MSVNRTDYIVYGWKLPYELKNENGKIDLWADKFLPYIEGHKGETFTLVSDGMCGGYNVFGKLLAHATDDGDGWGFMNLDMSNLNADEVKNKYRELFELKEDELIAEPYLFIFSHFSYSGSYFCQRPEIAAVRREICEARAIGNGVQGRVTHGVLHGNFDVGRSTGY